MKPSISLFFVLSGLVACADSPTQQARDGAQVESAKGSGKHCRTLYLDSDADGYGDAGSTLWHCGKNAKKGYAEVDGDCDDSDAAISPDAIEVCDGGIDNDCNGSADDDDSGLDTSTGATFYADADGDGFGDAGSSGAFCVQPSGYTTDTSDCDDADAAISPAAQEVCDSVDNDCDGSIDDDDASVDLSTGSTFYADADADGYGDPSTSTQACAQPSGAVSDASDCDDADASISPAGLEVCDSVDNDCDGLVDDADPGVDTSAGSTFYADSDGDGFGDPSTSEVFCAMPSGYSTDNSDCDDSVDWVHPGATEVCDGMDTDCDASTDEDGLVSYRSGSTWTDYTSDFTTGATASFSGGELNFCAESWGSATYYGNVTINGVAVAGLGGSVTLDGEKADSVFTVYGTSSISDLEITNGQADQGSGIYASGANLTLDGLEIHDNDNTYISTGYFGTEDHHGGGIYARYSTVDLVDSEVYTNRAYSEGGGIALEDSTMNMDNSDVWNNASGSNGTWTYQNYGGHGVLLTRSTLNMDNGSAIRSNYGTGWGGLRITVYSTVNCTDSDIIYNGFDGIHYADTSYGQGGVHLTSNSTLNASNCSLGDASYGENWGFDVIVGQFLSGGIHSYGNNETFTCETGYGTANTCY